MNGAGAVGGAQPSQSPVPANVSGSQQNLGQVGNRGGESLLVRSSSSAFADAAEEMSMVANQFKKNLDKRKLKSGSRLTADIMKRVQYSKTTPVQGVKDLLNKFQSQESLTDQQVREELERFSDDPVDQYVALDIAVEYFEELGDKEKADQLRALRDDIKTNNGTLIKVAENISETAAEFSEFGSVREIREGYTSHLESSPDHVRDDQSLEKLHAFLTEHYGTEDVEKAIMMQLKLLSSDLSKTESSVSPEQLQSIINDLSKLKQLVALLDDCIETEEQLSRTYPETEVKENVLVKQLLGIVQQQWVTEANIQKIPEEMNINQLGPQIFTLTKMVAIVKMIPSEVFVNEETKQSIVVAASEALEGKVEDEAGEELIDVGGNEGFLDIATIGSAIAEGATDNHENVPPSETGTAKKRKSKKRSASENSRDPIKSKSKKLKENNENNQLGYGMEQTSKINRKRSGDRGILSNVGNAKRQK